MGRGDSKMMKQMSISRRQALKGISALGAAALAGPGLAQAQTNGKPPRFCIVLFGGGGASIVDSLMAVRGSESSNASTLNTFPDQLVHNISDSPFRAVDQDRAEIGQIPAGVEARQRWFVEKHKQDLMVSTWTRTSVNHSVGQRRSVTGNEIWAGRTLQEIVALNYGQSHALPNVHLSVGNGYTERGADSSLPAWAFGETVADPRLWPLSLDGRKGIPTRATEKLLAKARRLRNETLDPRSRFSRIFGTSPRLNHWQSLRGARQASIESADLIRKLMLAPDSNAFPLSRYGLEASPELARVREVFPDIDLDPLQAQAAMAFLLIKYGVSVTVTLGPSFDIVIRGEENIFDGGLGGGGGPLLDPGVVINTPIAFDFSHQGHRSTQGLMWNRLYTVADGLISLLKAEEFEGGSSFWDHSMIYLASDFGRTKTRPAGANEFGTSHHLNNGIAVLSPLVRGNTVLGGVDPDTLLTYGYDPQTGEPDTGRNMTETEVFAGLLQAMDIDTSEAGLPDMRAMRRG